MEAFTYKRPSSLRELVEILDHHGESARILAGGTDLMVKATHGIPGLKVVVDIKGVGEVSDSVESDGAYVSIGARAIMREIIIAPPIVSNFPALVSAGKIVGSRQIRNRATIAGNICTASPAADTVPPLLVYGATVELYGPKGRREVALKDFFTGPGRTVKAFNEVVLSVRIPVTARPSGSAFGRVTRRQGVDLASVNMAALLDDSGVARFAFGAVAPTPILVEDTTGTLCNRSASEAAIRDSLETLLSHTKPISDVRAAEDYRNAMLVTMSRRVHTEALAALARSRNGG